MPASTGTDGRGGRLRAVQARASASTSRVTRNFMVLPTPALPTGMGAVVDRSTRAGSSSHGAPRSGRRSIGPGAGLIVPGAGVRGETPPLPAPPGAASPPCLGFENFWDNSLILVITRVEAGDG